MKIKLYHSKKLIVIAILITSAVVLQGFAQQGKEKDKKEEAPTNLKVLPKDISGEDLHATMRMYCKALGVRCGFCHVAKPNMEPGAKPKLDFAADGKEEKTTAREMITMVESINKNHIGKMTDKTLEKVTCVTCHMGSPKPMISVDSLKTSPAGWPAQKTPEKK